MTLVGSLKARHGRGGKKTRLSVREREALLTTKMPSSEPKETRGVIAKRLGRDSGGVWVKCHSPPLKPVQLKKKKQAATQDDDECFKK